MSNAIEFNISGCDTLISQSKRILYYYPKKEALLVITDIHSRGYEWVFNGSNQNDTLDHSPYEWSYTTKLSIDSGQEAMAQFGVSALFKGLSMTISDAKRVFSETEAATATTHKAIATVRPGSTVYVWQKRYRFRIEVWFLLNAWGCNWAVGDREVGSDEEKVILKREGEIHIDANEYRSSLVNLSGQGQTSVVPMQVEPMPPMREWEHLTDLSRDAIQKEINI